MTCCRATRNLFGTSIVQKNSNSSNATLLHNPFWLNQRKVTLCTFTSAVYDAVVSSVLDKEDRGEQCPIFYSSQRMTDAETRYSTLEKMALAVMTSARKLRPYFHSHSIIVLTNLPLRTIMQNAKSFGQTLKMGNRAQKVRCYISKQASHKVASTG